MSDESALSASGWPEFYSNYKPLPDKHGACASCHSHPPKKQKFRKCGACKAVLYCGPECQKLYVLWCYVAKIFVRSNLRCCRDWKGHRDLCTKGLMERVGGLGPPNVYYYED